MLITYCTDTGTTTVLASTIIRLDHIEDGRDEHGERTVVETSTRTFIARENASQCASNVQAWREAITHG